MVMKEAVKRVNLDPAEIGELYYGITVLLEPATNLDIPARMATLKAGFPASTLSLTIDRACSSSIMPLNWHAGQLNADRLKYQWP